MADYVEIQKFRDKIRGEVIFENDSDYDDARSLWNGMIDNRPALIIMCCNVQDVISCVKFAHSNQLIVCVKGGGHGVAGKAVCNDGLMINLSKMKSIQVNLKDKTVTVAPGVTLGDLDEATQVYGLSVPVGIASTTGVSGLTLGGGIGFICRAYGLTIDNLISAEVVLANGEVVFTNMSENSDLFWGIRGGGGNFGIVTSFKFKLHSVGPEVMTAQQFYAIEDGMDVLKFYRKFTKKAPNKLSCYCLGVTVPPIEPFPKENHGKSALLLLGCYSGDLTTGKQVIKELESFGSPILSLVGPMPFVSFQKNLDHLFPKGMRYYWKSHFMNDLSDEALEVFYKGIQPIFGSLTGVGFEPLGGAVSKVKTDDTAFPQRQANYVLGIWTGWESPLEDDINISWARNFHKAMAPYAAEGVYSNYLSGDDDHLIKKSFGANYKRLQRIKRKYDPTNFFSRNQNINPNS